MMKPKMQSYKQTLYKVGFGPNVWGILSEDGIRKVSNIVGYEYYGEREIFYQELHEQENFEFISMEGDING